MSKLPTQKPIFNDSQFTGEHLWIDFKLLAWSSDVLSIRFDKNMAVGGIYYPQMSYSINYSLRMGEQFRVDDLFKTEAAFEVVVSDQIANAVQKLSLRDEEKEAVLRHQHHVWNITDRGILITLDDPYLRYITRHLEILIPSSMLRQCTIAGSPLTGFWDGE
jgi:hypothetical protein